MAASFIPTKLPNGMGITTTNKCGFGVMTPIGETYKYDITLVILATKHDRYKRGIQCLTLMVKPRCFPLKTDWHQNCPEVSQWLRGLVLVAFASPGIGALATFSSPAEVP